MNKIKIKFEIIKFKNTFWIKINIIKLLLIIINKNNEYHK